jgi:hypothetical protein
VGDKWWLVVGGWLVAGGWWLVAGGWWLVVGGWWLVTSILVFDDGISLCGNSDCRFFPRIAY